jgi:hypothetical protein
MDDFCEDFHCVYRSKTRQRATFIDLIKNEKLCLGHAQERNRLSLKYNAKPMCISLREYTFSLLSQE